MEDFSIESEHEAPRVTTVEDREWKAKIEPYGATPTMHLEPGVIGCLFCANTKFRRSRVRFHDLRELLLLRYPMRCMRCNQRQYGYFLTAGLALAPRGHGVRMSRGSDTWKAWTEANVDGPQTSQRPMTTSVGTRATKLERPVRPPASPRSEEAWRDEDRQIW